MTQGVWYHLAFTFDYATRARKIYLNGSLVASNQAAFPFSGGNTLNFTSVNLTLDDFRLYNRALSAADVSALANLPSAPVTAPVITAQPASQTVAIGATAAFSVTASGSSTLSYQWRKDSIDLPGATAATFAIPNAQPVHIGDYSVVVSQPGGSVTSATAALTIPNVPTGIWKGLAAYYTFEGQARDQTLHGLHARVVSVGFAADRFGRSGHSLDFNGIGYIEIPNKTFLQGARAVAISLWFYSRLGGQEGFLVQAADGRAGLDPFTLAISRTGDLGGVFTDCSLGPSHPERNIMEGVNVKLSPVVGRWTHVVFQFNSTEATSTGDIFIDGVLRQKAIYAHSHRIFFDIPMPVLIGNHGNFPGSFRGADR